MTKKLIRQTINKLLRIGIIKTLIQDIDKSIREDRFLMVTEPLLSFHGDQYLLNLINFLLLESKNFVETGTRTGVTLKYVADGYNHLNLFSCEPDKNYFLIAEKKLEGYKKCKIYNETSQTFIPKILDKDDINENLTFFFLDAHGRYGGYDWPLRQEVEQITHRLNRSIILIDDFKVPNNPQFGYDMYNGQECKMSFIRDRLYSKRNYEFIYSKYKIKTSNHDHFRGYIVILMGLGIEAINIPKQLFENYTLIKQ